MALTVLPTFQVPNRLKEEKFRIPSSSPHPRTSSKISPPISEMRIRDAAAGCPRIRPHRHVPKRNRTKSPTRIAVTPHRLWPRSSRSRHHLGRTLPPRWGRAAPCSHPRPGGSARARGGRARRRGSARPRAKKRVVRRRTAHVRCPENRSEGAGGSFNLLCL